MRRIEELLQAYGSSHTNRTNKVIHWVCVPLIFLSIVGLIWSIPNDFIAQFLSRNPNPFANWATVLLVMVIAYYFSLSISLGIGMAIFSTLCLFIIKFIDEAAIAPVWQISLGIFVIAWIGQFYGHKLEGAKPSFLKDLQFLLIGPAWLLHFIYKQLGIPY